MPAPRPAVSTIPPATHGSRDYSELRRLGLNPAEVVDFSSNTNPYGPHPAVVQAVRAATSDTALAHYPDRDCLALRAALAAADDLAPEHILPGNGVTELIYLVASAFVWPGSRHLILSPTFGEYSRAIHLAGGILYEHRPQTLNNLTLKAEEVVAIIRRVQPDGVWFCNPNNPTGQLWTPEELANLYAADSKQRMLWVIDESYRHFVARSVNWPDHAPSNLIRLRSLTKDYSLAGLRLGYAVAAPELMNALRAAQPPWSVNSLAQVAGVAALQPEVIAWREQTLAQLQDNAAILWTDLSGLGMTILPTTTTFALAAVEDAALFRRWLLQDGLLVRDCASFGLPGYIRIAANRPEANRQLVRAIAVERQPVKE